jgi:DNA mismatch repair protein MSH4
LELINNISDKKSKASLYGVMNHVQTAMGARILRTSILQPHNDIVTIEGRLDCVQELVVNENLFFAIQGALKGFPDIDHLISSFVQSPRKSGIKSTEQSINAIITLKSILESVKVLQESLADVSCSILKAVLYVSRFNKDNVGRGSRRASGRYRSSSQRRHHVAETGTRIAKSASLLCSFRL